MNILEVEYIEKIRQFIIDPRNHNALFAEELTVIFSVIAKGWKGKSRKEVSKSFRFLKGMKLNACISTRWGKTVVGLDPPKGEHWNNETYYFEINNTMFNGNILYLYRKEGREKGENQIELCIRELTSGLLAYRMINRQIVEANIGVYNKAFEDGAIPLDVLQTVADLENEGERKISETLDKINKIIGFPALSK